MASSWLHWVVIALLLGVVCCVLYKIGQLLRQGVELRKHIDGERVAALVFKKPYDREKYNQLNRDVRFRGNGALIVPCILYIIIGIEVGVTVLLVALLSLVIVGFGYSRYRVEGKMPSLYNRY